MVVLIIFTEQHWTMGRYCNWLTWTTFKYYLNLFFLSKNIFLFLDHNIVMMKGFILLSEAIAMSCRVTQDRWVTVKSSDKMWSTGVGNGNLLQYSCLESTVDTMKRQKDMTLKNELLLGWKVSKYGTWEEWMAISNSSRKNEVPGQKWKWCWAVDIVWWWK